MLKKIALCCAVVSAYWVPFYHAHGQECQILRVGGSNRWYPVSYINHETQEPEGIANDLIKLVGKKLGIPVMHNVEFPWNRTLYYLKHGRLDMISAIYWTKEREKWFQYTVPYIANNARVFVVKGKEFPFEQLEDLVGRTGIIPLGGSFGNEFDTFAKEHKLQLEHVNSKEQIIRMTITGRADYFILDYLDASIYLKQQGLQEQFVALPYTFSTTNVHFAVSRQSPCIQLTLQIDDIISKAKQDGTLHKIVEKYIKPDFR